MAEHNPVMVSPSVVEVWKTLPSAQRAAITEYTYNFSQGWDSFRYKARQQYYIPEDKEGPASHRLAEELDALVRADLELADGNLFPELSPRRAMQLIRLAKPIGARLLGEPEASSIAPVESCAVALTGLHWSILGAERLVQSDAAQANLEQAANNMHTSSFSVFLRS